MTNEHNSENLLSVELKQDIELFADKVADIMSPVFSIFIIEIEDGCLSVINTAGGALFAKGYPLVFEAVYASGIYKKAAIIEHMNNYFAAMMPTPLEEEIYDLVGWYSTTFGSDEEMSVFATKDHLFVSTKYTPELSLSRADYPNIHAACSSDDGRNEVVRGIRELCIGNHTDIQHDNSGVYVYSYELLQGDSDSPTLYKVGRSKDVKKRLEQQGRQASKTVQLGDLVPARFYPTSNPVRAEKIIHDTLKEIGAHRKSSGSGSEWFETTLADIDEIAAGVGLLPASLSPDGSYTSRGKSVNADWNVLLHS